MNPTRNSILTTIMAAALTMASCSRLPIYSHFEAVDQHGWDRADTLQFAVPVKQTGIYRLQLDLRANSQFPYTQLTVLTHAQARRSHIAADSSFLFDITDAQGYTAGNGTGICQYQATLPPLSLIKNDTLRIAVRHGMSREVLPGIVDVGITVEKEE